MSHELPGWVRESSPFLSDSGSISRSGALRSQLEARGLVLLAVSSHRSDPELFTVYLHGTAAQWVNGEAVRVTASVPGVLDVVESIQSPSILLVRVASA